MIRRSTFERDTLAFERVDRDSEEDTMMDRDKLVSEGQRAVVSLRAEQLLMANTCIAEVQAALDGGISPEELGTTDAERSNPELAKEALQFIRKLYEVEAQLRNSARTSVLFIGSSTQGRCSALRSSPIT